MKTGKKLSALSRFNKWIVYLILCITISASYSPSLRSQDRLPESVDLSMSRYFPTVANQGKIGSCDWFAAVYYQMTYLYNKEYDRSASPLNTFSPKFGYNILNNAGIFPYNIRIDDVYKFVQKHGCATIQQWPYDMADGTGYKTWCTDGDTWQEALWYRIEGYEYFTLDHSAPGANQSFDNYPDFFREIKNLLAHGEILVIQSNPFTDRCVIDKISDDPAIVTDDTFRGEYILSRGDNDPDHTMAVVGYNDNIWTDLNKDGIVQPGEKGALKIVDSFGENGIPYRNKGFIWMAYHTVPHSIFQNRVNRMFTRKNYKPLVICRLTLNSAHRDKIKFQFGRGLPGNQETSAQDDLLIFDPAGMGYEKGTSGVSLIEGGDLSYTGTTTPADGNFVFDLTDIYAGDNQSPWYFKIENAGEYPLIIKKFEIINRETGRTFSDPALPLAIEKKEVYRLIGGTDN